MKLTLQNVYHAIRPWERIRLLLAAEQRQDEVEYQRLFHASPIKTWHFSEHLLAEQALHVLALTYITEQLDAATSVFIALFQLSHHPDQDSLQLERMAETSGYFFTCNQQGWIKFCEELQVNPDSLVRGNHDGWFLAYSNQLIPTIALTAEELAIQYTLAGPLVTSDDMARRWHERLREMVQSTPLDTPEASS